MGETGIREIFLEEAQEILESLESDIIQLEENPNNPDVINQIFRRVHTLKGSSGIAGFSDLSDFTHKLENLLDGVRTCRMGIDNAMIDLILKCIDWIKEEIFSQDKDEQELQKNHDDLLLQLDKYKCDNDKIKSEKVSQKGHKSMSEIDNLISSMGEEKFIKVSAKFREDIFQYGIDPLMIIEDLLETGELVYKKVDKSALPDFTRLDPEKCYIDWEILLKTKKDIDEIKGVFLFVSDENDISVEDVTRQFKEIKTSGASYTEKKLGEILVEQGIISQEALDEVIEVQGSQNVKLGEVMVKKGMANEKQIQEALNEQDKIKKKIEVSTVRVDTAKLDNILNLLGEIVIGQAGLTGFADSLGEDNEIGSQLKNALFGLERTTREFQEQIMSIRMIPIGPTFEQFRRFVRDTAHAGGKDIKLIIEGGETELDKTVIEKISDPLKHMIRNSIDHGIEPATVRKLHGKNETGRIMFRAYHQEGNVYIDIIDDGQGIDPAKIKKKAESLGFLRSGEEVTQERLYSFLFHPGFSTAEKVGELSGRGVGMDVVKTNIEELRGSVEIRSELNRGTIVRIKLPLTLAIIDGMLISIGSNIYIIPLLSVVESIQPKKDEVKTVEGKGEVILVRGEYIPFLRMYEKFDIEARYTEPFEGLVVIAESGNTRVGLLIDDLLGQQQIVIKSLDSYISNSRAISGAAILGDGKVALIIDIHGLLEDANYKKVKS